MAVSAFESWDPISISLKNAKSAHYAVFVEPSLADSDKDDWNICGFGIFLLSLCI